MYEGIQFISFLSFMCVLTITFSDSACDFFGDCQYNKNDNNISDIKCNYQKKNSQSVGHTPSCKIKYFLLPQSITPIKEVK